MVTYCHKVSELLRCFQEEMIISGQHVPSDGKWFCIYVLLLQSVPTTQSASQYVNIDSFAHIHTLNRDLLMSGRPARPPEQQPLVIIMICG